MKLRHLTLILALSPLTVMAKTPTAAERISEANFNYCMEEILAEEQFCRCTSDIYKKAVADSDLTEPEVDLMVRAFSGQLPLDEFSDEDFAISEGLSDKINMEEHEDEFMQCATYIESEANGELAEEVEEDASEEQKRAIREAEEIEAMEDLDTEDDLIDETPLTKEDATEEVDQKSTPVKAAESKEKRLKEEAEKANKEAKKALEELKENGDAVKKDLKEAKKDLKKTEENLKALDFKEKK